MEGELTVRSLMWGDHCGLADDVVIGGVVLAPGGAAVPSVAGDREREVRMLGVLADARRLGAARALMTRCLQVALERGAPAVALWTRPQMLAAQRLYEQLGFKRTPERDFDLDGITMLTYRYSFTAQAT